MLRCAAALLLVVCTGASAVLMRSDKQLDMKVNIDHDGKQAVVKKQHDRVKKTLWKSHGLQFQLQTSEEQNHLKIPKQVVLTGPFESLREMRQQRSDLRTSLRSLGITSELRVKYLNNRACRAYLAKSNPELVTFFDEEKHGSYRGDICRAAVLAKEGGYYVDLDLQLSDPLHNLVDDATTFMTARADSDAGALNALIATVPENPVMLATLAHMRKWYHNKTSQTGIFGPVTMQRGLEEVMSQTCPERHWANAYMQFKCGSQHEFRLFTERLIGGNFAAGSCQKWGRKICPKHRARSQFGGAKYGLFDTPEPFPGQKVWMGHITSPSKDDIAAFEQRFIGWSRFDGCKGLGCGLTGGEHS